MLHAYFHSQHALKTRQMLACIHKMNIQPLVRLTASVHNEQNYFLFPGRQNRPPKIKENPLIFQKAAYKICTATVEFGCACHLRTKFITFSSIQFLLRRHRRSQQALVVSQKSAYFSASAKLCFGVSRRVCLLTSSIAIRHLSY